jgi:metallophosphoesterase (TIGR00282 family)
MRVLGIGDVIGKPGRQAVKSLLAGLRRTHGVDLVVANAENAAGGLGTTAETADDLLAAGVDVLTGGNHTWKHREYAGYLSRQTRALRPYNYPPDAPGRGLGVYALADGRAYAVLNLIGRTFMEAVENPFSAAERAIAEIAGRARVVIVDMHAEASSEKRAMGWHLDGRASVVWGTHTHVPTADEEILPRGTGYLGDVGMTGPYASVIGLVPANAVKKFVTSRPTPYEVATGNVQLRAVLVDIDDATGRCRAIERLTERLDEPLAGPPAGRAPDQAR